MQGLINHIHVSVLIMMLVYKYFTQLKNTPPMYWVNKRSINQTCDVFTYGSIVSLSDLVNGAGFSFKP